MSEKLINLPLERTVLGRMLCFGALPVYIGAGLTDDDFYRESHRKLFAVMREMDSAGLVLDVVSARMELRKRNLLDEIGGDHYLGVLSSDVLPTSSVTMLLEVSELADLAARRLLMQAVPGSDLADIAAQAEQALNRSADERRVYDASSQLETIRQDIQRDTEGRIFLGFPTLDGILEGIRAGEVFGLMARPGIGKTLVLCHVCRAVADTDFGHVFFSLEMPAAQIVERVARAHYGLSRSYLRNRLSGGGLDAEDYATTFRRLVVVDAPGLSVAQMGAKLRQIQASLLKDVPIRLVTIDHLGLVGGDRKMTTYDRVSTQARELKELAKRFNTSVLLAVQVNRESGGDGSKELSLGSARDSGVVEEAMDYLVAMRRPERSQTLSPFERERYRDTLFLKVIKNRHGAPDTEIGVRLDGMTLRLLEDESLRIQDDDLSKIAAQAGGRRR